MNNSNFELSEKAMEELTQVLAENGVSLGSDKEFEDLINNDLLVKMLETHLEFQVKGLV